MSGIKKERVRFGVTQMELSLEIGVSQAWVSLAEADKIELSPERLREVKASIRRVAERKQKLAETVESLVRGNEHGDAKTDQRG